MQLRSTPRDSVSPAVEADLGASNIAYQSIVEWLLSLEALGTPLHEIEAEHSRRGRELLRLLLQALALVAELAERQRAGIAPPLGLHQQRPHCWHVIVLERTVDLVLISTTR